MVPPLKDQQLLGVVRLLIEMLRMGDADKVIVLGMQYQHPAP